LNTSFEFFRTFKENAAGIFLKFDRFDEGFIDAEIPRFIACFCASATRARASFLVCNQVFTTTTVARASNTVSRSYSISTRLSGL
jgi:hypothetical protein